MRKRLLTLVILMLANSNTAIAEANDSSCQMPNGFERYSWIEPSNISADLDGDGLPDAALLIRQTKSKKQGILICATTSKLPFVVGAGTDFGNGGDNFDWMNIWELLPKSPAVARHDPNNRMAKQNQLHVGVDGGAGGHIYFEGGKFYWEQAGE